MRLLLPRVKRNSEWSVFSQTKWPVQSIRQVALCKDPPEQKRKQGSEALMGICAMGYRNMYDLPGEIKDFVQDIERVNGRISLGMQQ